MITFTVLNKFDGGDFMIEDFQQEFLEFFEDGFEQDFEKSIEVLTEVFLEGGRSDDEMKQFSDCVIEFSKMYYEGNYKVQFWGVETDVNITLVKK